jgi:hypothetical protein
MAYYDTILINKGVFSVFFFFFFFFFFTDLPFEVRRVSVMGINNDIYAFPFLGLCLTIEKKYIIIKTRLTLGKYTGS